MSRRDKFIVILVAVVWSAIFLTIFWRIGSVGEVVSTASHVEQHTPWLEVVKIPPAKEVLVATWYDYDLKDSPGYSLTHATAASRTYPRETQLLVCINECVQVRVNDYGPEEWTGKDIDLSSYAFKQLAPLSWGVIRVKITKL